MPKTFADSIASQMQATLKHPDHLAIFSQSMAADEKCDKCKCHPCECDKHSAKESKEEKSDSCATDDAHKHVGTGAPKFDDKKLYPDKAHADDGAMDADDQVVEAFDAAIGNLLSASSALDMAGLVKSADLTLELAQFVVEAKKKAKKKSDSKKSKDSKKSDKKDSKKDSKDSKKSDSKSKK